MLSFELYWWYVDAMWHHREEIKQRKIFRAFQLSPSLAVNIKELTISLTDHYPMAGPVPASEYFGKKSTYILRYARYLEYLTLVNNDRQLFPSFRMALEKRSLAGY
jgi:hypothetical protein